MNSKIKTYFKLKRKKKIGHSFSVFEYFTLRNNFIKRDFYLL